MYKFAIALVLLTATVSPIYSQTESTGSEEEFNSVSPHPSEYMAQHHKFGYNTKLRKSANLGLGSGIISSMLWQRSGKLEIGGGFTHISESETSSIIRDRDTENLLALTLDARLYIIRGSKFYAYVSGGAGPATFFTLRGGTLRGSDSAFGFGEYAGVGAEYQTPFPVRLTTEYRFQNVNYFINSSGVPSEFRHIWFIGVAWSWLNI